MRQFTFAGIPADSSGRTGQLDRAPSALRELGLTAALNASDAGDLDTVIGAGAVDADSGLRALDGLVEATLIIKRRTAHLVEDGKLPFLCGGCSAVAAAALAGAVSVAGPLGLAYVNAHSSLHDGDTSPTGHAASMTLSSLLGRGPQVWTSLLAPKPVLTADAVHLIGVRDQEETEEADALQPGDFRPALHVFSTEDIRSHGAPETGRAATALLAQSSQGFWLHIDLDVLNETAFPATNCNLPGGLDWEELAGVLKPLIQAPGLAGASLSGYRPDQDPGASSGLHLVDLFRSICR